MSANIPSQWMTLQKRPRQSRICHVYPLQRDAILGRKLGVWCPSQISVKVMTVRGPQSRGVRDHASNEGGRPWARLAPPVHRGRSRSRPCRCPCWRPRVLTPRDPRTRPQGEPGCSQPPGLRLLIRHSPFICAFQTSQQNFKEEKNKTTISCKLDIPVEASNYFSGQRAQFPALRCMIKIN